MTSIALMNDGHQLTMSSREISGLVGARHSDVMRSIERLMERGSIGGYAPTAYTLQQNGMQYQEYLIGKRDTYVIVAQMSPEFTAKLVDRWQELEGQVARPAELSRMEILKLAMESEQARIEAEEKIAIAAPKVEFFDRVVERGTLMSATQVAQKIGMSALAMNKMLDELDVYSKNVKRARVFKQWFIEKGFGELKQTEQGFSQPLFTTAGEAWVVERLTSEGVV